MQVSIRRLLLHTIFVVSSQAQAQGGLVWSTPVDLSAVGQDASEAAVAISSDGTRATAVWSRLDGSNFVIQSASATISGGTATWGSVTDLSVTGHQATDPRVAVSRDGTDAIAVWEYADSVSKVQAAIASISGTTASWSSPTDISNTAQYAVAPDVAMSANG